MTHRLAIGLLAGALVLAAPPLARGAGAAVPGAAVPGAAGRIAAAISAPDPGALRFGRALERQRHGDLRGVVEQLEGIAFGTRPAFAGADRAAFLLAQAYLRLGDTAHFGALADAVARWPQAGSASACLSWLALERALLAPGTGAAGDSLADALTRGGAAGRDVEDAERIRAAVQAMARGGDAEPLLARVSPGGRYGARARHLRGLLALERGDDARATALLSGVFAADTAYAGRREAGMALLSTAMEHGRWHDAMAVADELDRDWTAQRDALRRLRAAGSYDAVWAAWAASPDSVDAVVIDAGPTLASASALADRIARGAASVPAPGAPGTPAAAAPAGPRVRMPDRERWRAVEASARGRDAARGALERSRWELAREDEALADRRRYLALGLDSLRRADARLAAPQARLDSLRGALDALDASLRDVRDREAARVQRRSAALLAACAEQAAWAQALEQLYVAGPDSARYQSSPAGLPSAAVELAAERELVTAVGRVAGSVAASAPGWLARSYERSWSQRLPDRAVAQAAEIGRQRRAAAALAATLDSSLERARTSAAREQLAARAGALARTADSLAAADAALRASVAREAVDHTLGALEHEREGIDYGRATALDALAAGLSAADSGRAGAVAARDTARSPGDEQDSPETQRLRARALPALGEFLTRHPDSPVRGEVRFRLADLELSQARQDFRERMAEFVRRQSAGHAAGLAVPVLDPHRALALYDRMLAEDPGFPHLDAVRFDAGMILADAGQPGAERYFSQLVATAPDSPYAQEAWLRMGDLAFDAKRLPECIGRYAHAAAGPDPTLAAIAMYKQGWAHDNRDEFEPAAGAFRGVLDLYAAHRADIHVDIEREASDYLVHALVGAGGAAAFARDFGHGPGRPYEQDVLMALGQQLRRYGRLADAAAADALVLERYPDAPVALLAAQRQVETWHRAGQNARELEARLALAPRFAPGGDWSRRQASDSVRTAGEAFAQDSYLAVARAHHERARRGGANDEWRQALDAYATVLARWPHDAHAPELDLDASEASARLADYPGALRWLASAAREGRDSTRAIALEQRVAVTDAWYEHARAGAATGPDSLAHAVLTAGDALLAAVPNDARATDVTWRQSQLAIAHGWDERAAADLARMVDAHERDARAPLAAVQRGEVLFRLGRFDDAGEAFARAEAVARAQGRDSLAHHAQRAEPVAAYRAAEAAVAADSTAFGAHAERFERVATRWPDYELAPLAQYRAGLERERAGQGREEVRVLQALLQRFPRCAWAGDARLRIAQAWEGMGERESAAEAYLEFSRGTADQADAGAAWLKAADLLAAAGRDARADELRLDYVHRHPEDVDAALSILEALARRDLATVAPGRPVSVLLGTAVRGRRAAPPASYVARYLVLAAAHPLRASRDLVAHVRFLQGEEAGTAFAAVRLTQPLARSVPVKKALLDTLLARYRRCADLGVPAWAHAAAFRIGEALEGFADALRNSEAPADLAGDDLLAYRNVLGEKAAVFGRRGEDVWAELLRRPGADSTADEWTTRARAALTAQLAQRLRFLPEVEFPLVEAAGPQGTRTAGAPRGDAGRDEHPASDPAPRTLARRQGATR